MEENKVAQITKHTYTSRSTDSGVSDNGQTGAREIRKSVLTADVAQRLNEPLTNGEEGLTPQNKRAPDL